MGKDTLIRNNKDKGNGNDNSEGFNVSPTRGTSSTAPTHDSNIRIDKGSGMDSVIPIRIRNGNSTPTISVNNMCKDYCVVIERITMTT
jgi:hypothetical protein